MNLTNETLLFDRFLIMYDLCVFTCIIFIFVYRCTHVRMSYVLNSYLLTYLHIEGYITYVRWRVNFPLTWPWPSQPAVGHLYYQQIQYIRWIFITDSQ